MMKTAVKNKEVEKMKALEEGEVFAVLNSLVKQRKTLSISSEKADVKIWPPRKSRRSRS
jgi:uncharacterized protein YqeY